MDENKAKEENLAEEIRQLGRNLTAALQAAWERPERKRLQGEIANALNELGVTLRQETQKVSESPAGQRVRSEAEELRDRLRSADLDNRARQELYGALHAANDLLRQAITRLSSEPEERERKNPGVPEEDKESTPMKDTGHREVHPDDVESNPAAPSERQEVHPDDAE